MDNNAYVPKSVDMNHKVFGNNNVEDYMKSERELRKQTESVKPGKIDYQMLLRYWNGDMSEEDFKKHPMYHALSKEYLDDGGKDKFGDWGSWAQQKLYPKRNVNDQSVEE